MDAEKVLESWEKIAPEVEKMDEHTKELIIAHTQGVMAGSKLLKRKEAELDGGQAHDHS